MLKDKRILLVLLGIVVLGGGSYLYLRADNSPEAQVRAVINDIEEAIEGKDVGDVFEHIAEDYTEGAGLGRRELRGLLLHRFLTTKAIRIQRLGGIGVDVRADGTALATFRSTLREGNSLEALRNVATYDFVVKLREQDGEWLVTGHTRTRP